jgi:ELWxxDGT repeat protein
MVKDIFAGATGSMPFDLTNVSGTLFFDADNGITGKELWKSTGTAAGTVLVKDIDPGPFGGYPEHLVNVNGVVFFEAANGVSGMELWKSNGTAPGTVLVKDIKSGPLSSFPAFLTNANGTLFFKADNGVNGFEPWVLDPAAFSGEAIGASIAATRPGGEVAIVKIASTETDTPAAAGRTEATTPVGTTWRPVRTTEQEWGSPDTGHTVRRQSERSARNLMVMIADDDDAPVV